MDSRKCKFCKAEFSGRKDKIFCRPICKAYYHRQLKRITNKATRSFDKVLHRNRSILFEFMGDNTQQKKVDRELLAKKNFRFEYMTGFYENAKGKRYHLVYDFAWMEFKNNQVLIVRRFRDNKK